MMRRPLPRPLFRHALLICLIALVLGYTIGRLCAPTRTVHEPNAAIPMPEHVEPHTPRFH